MSAWATPPQRKIRWRTSMTGLKILATVGLMSTIAAGPTFADFAHDHPDAYEAEYPNRDLDGTLTPAGRIGLELPDGAANVSGADNALAQMGSANSDKTGPCVREQDVGAFATAPWTKPPCVPGAKH